MRVGKKERGGVEPTLLVFRRAKYLSEGLSTQHDGNGKEIVGESLSIGDPGQPLGLDAVKRDKPY